MVIAVVHCALQRQGRSCSPNDKTLLEFVQTNVMGSIQLNHGPKHHIDTSKLRALGMTFWGRPRLEETVMELVSAAQAAG